MIYSGIIKYENAEIAFQFDDFKLSIYPSRELFESLTKRESGIEGLYVIGKQPFADGFLVGKVNGQQLFIHFFFDPLGYGTEITSFIDCQITINIMHYIVYNCESFFPAKEVILRYRSKQLHRFLCLIPNYEVSRDTSKELCGTVKCDTDILKCVSRGKINGVKIELMPGYSCKWGGNNFHFCPEFVLKASEIGDEKQLFKFYKAINRLVIFAFMRLDIAPDEFLIQAGKNKGEIHSNIIYKYEKEDCDSIWHDSISWRILYKHAMALFKKVYLDKWYLDNIPATKVDRLLVNDIAISKEAAAFEHEFSLQYPEGLPIHSKKRIDAEKEVEAELTPLLKQSRGKKKDIYKGFMSHIRNESLKDKIKFCLKEYAPCIKWLKEKTVANWTNENIAKRIANHRNDTDHGNKSFSLNHKSAAVYVLFRGLNYAMRLKRLGFEPEDINKAVRCLFYVKGIAR